MTVWEQIINNVFVKDAIIIVVFLLISIVTNKIINHMIERINRTSLGGTKKVQTVIRLIKNCFRYLYIILAIFCILYNHGVDIMALAAGAGATAIVIGVALQDFFKDIIGGINIVTDNYFNVGDVVKIDDIEGEIIQIGMKATKMKDLVSGAIVIKSNRSFSEAMLLPDVQFINIPLPYEESAEDMEKVLLEITELAKQHPDIKNAEYKGIADFADSAIIYRVNVYCEPSVHFQTIRDFRVLVKKTLDKHGISIPYSQIVIHRGND